jgi:hypothetical protein
MRSVEREREKREREEEKRSYLRIFDNSNLRGSTPRFQCLNIASLARPDEEGREEKD